MCNQWCLDFVRRCSTYWPNKVDILEAGSLNVNGSPRDSMPDRKGFYVGVDIVDGPGVDMICGVENLVNAFGPDAFDVVISTEMLEHVEDWHIAVEQMIKVLKPGGWLCLTTRSPGFEYHEYPIDRWRFTVEHMRAIFIPPMGLYHCETDPDLRKGRYSGVGVLAYKAYGDLDQWFSRVRRIDVATP